MSETSEFEVLDPQYTFWEVCIEESEEDSESGKVKRTKHVHLVDEVTAGAVEKKVAKMMDGTLWEWKIVSIKQSKVSSVY